MRKLAGNTGVEIDTSIGKIKISSFVLGDNLSNLSTIILRGKIRNAEKIKELAETVDKLNVPSNFTDFQKNCKNIFLEISKHIENVEEVYIEINRGEEDIGDSFAEMFRETIRNFGNIDMAIKSGLDYLKFSKI